MSMTLPGPGGLPVTFHILAMTRANDALMVRGEKSPGDEGWVLPNGTVPAGQCPILTARKTLTKATGYDRALTDVLAFTLTTDDRGAVNGVTYVLDGDVVPEVPPMEPNPSVGWVPLRELHEPPGLYQYAIIAAGRRRALPLLVDGDRPEAAFH
ncbi:NUDIX domain-containing protein [Streptomyces sp. NBRC 109706]|uniref:NUDIX domain-containing protein n=1 Tax=Streptomyces sp. NBRC 109706 TaxID=1550035 RepID=UPI0007848A80|nr:NUDIX hydrolase [Streptomyces sp. NBRC 109706]